MSCAKLPRLAPAFKARIAFADSDPKLIAEMLKMLALYGWARPAPITTRKSCDFSTDGCIEWLIHS